MAARLFHIRKYHRMVRDQVRALQESREEAEQEEGRAAAPLGRHLLSRMLLLEELEETVRQLERLEAEKT